jgi:hypothetical protein
MKKILFGFGLLIMTASCTKIIDKLTTFQFKREASFTIPATSTLGIPVSLNSTEVTTAYESEFSSNNTSVDRIEYIKIVGLNLEIENPPNGDFNFLKSVELAISSDGLPDKVIASRSDLGNEGLQKIELDATEEDLKPYLTQEKFTLKIEAVTDEITTQDYDLKTEATFEAKAETTN